MSQPKVEKLENFIAAITLPREATIENLGDLPEDLVPAKDKFQTVRIIAAHPEQNIDTTYLSSLLYLAARRNKAVTFEFLNFSESQQKIINLVQKKLQIVLAAETDNSSASFVESTGKLVAGFWQTAQEILSFLGQFTLAIFKLILRPRSFRIKEFIAAFDAAFIGSIVVLILLSSLIGLVLSYLFAMQAEQYGASIFIVDALSQAICRELGPVLVAILVAGRSGSAYTAQIGAMKINEEIDAIKVLGLSVYQTLIIPRTLALIIALPLLIILSDIVGISASAVIADLELGINYDLFYDRLKATLTIRTFLLGLVKAPFFGVAIALIACYKGLTVENNAGSVGRNTTATVVNCIIAIVVINAFFAILFPKLSY